MLGAAGATGIAAVQIGKAMGATVIARRLDRGKARHCRRQPAPTSCDRLREPQGPAQGQSTGGKGVDVAFDPVGGEAFDGLARSMAWGGRLLVIGFASGTIPKFPVNLALVKGFSVVGVFWGAFTDKEPRGLRRQHAELIGW